MILRSMETFHDPHGPGLNPPRDPLHLRWVDALVHGRVARKIGKDDGGLAPLACFGQVAGLGGGASTGVMA